MIVMNMETCVNVRKYLNRFGLRALLIFSKEELENDYGPFTLCGT